jgi:hypothetical protein
VAWREDGGRKDVGVITSRHRVNKMEQGTLTVMETLPVSRDE